MLPESQAFNATNGDIHDDSNVDLNETPAQDSGDHGELRLQRSDFGKDSQEGAEEIDDEAFEDERALDHDQGSDQASEIHIKLHRING
jgi:hypothetical protein